jgi:hypothetical protein
MDVIEVFANIKIKKVKIIAPEKCRMEMTKNGKN